jgi:hypothetical protein
MMTTFTTEDREKATLEPIPFFGWCYLTDAAHVDKSKAVVAATKKPELHYKIDEGSEDLEN